MGRYAMGKEIAINNPLSGLGWRMNAYMNVCLGTASLYYFLLITLFFLLHMHTSLNPHFSHLGLRAVQV